MHTYHPWNTKKLIKRLKKVSVKKLTHQLKKIRVFNLIRKEKNQLFFDKCHL